MELKLKVKPTRGTNDCVAWCNDYGTAVICRTDINSFLPELDENKELFAIFTKTAKGNHDYFELEPRGIGVTAFDGTYYGMGKRKMREAYRDGFRHLHFEQPA